MSSLAKGLTAAGVAAVIAVGGTAAVTSANAENGAAAPAATQQVAGEGSAATGPTGSTSGTGRSGGFGGMASRSLLAGALHGEFVVSDGSGTVTERLQTGVITSVSATSIAVKSTDDYTATYAVASGTDVSSLAAGATVTVIATVDGNTATVVSISTAAQGGTGSRGTGSGGTGSGEAGSSATGAGGTGSGDSGV